MTNEEAIGKVKEMLDAVGPVQERVEGMTGRCMLTCVAAEVMRETLTCVGDVLSGMANTDDIRYLVESAYTVGTSRGGLIGVLDENSQLRRQIDAR